MRHSILKSLLFLLIFAAASFSIQPSDFTDDSDTKSGISNEAFKVRFSTLRQLLLSDVTSSTKSLKVHSGPLAQSVQQRLNNQLASSGSQVQLTRTDVDPFGITHLRFQQYYFNLEVFNAVVVVHIGKDSTIKATTGYWSPTLSLDLTAKVSKEEAEKVVLKRFAALKDFVCTASPNPLILGQTLVWQFHVRKEGIEPISMRCFVNAYTGDYVAEISQIQHAGPSDKGEHVKIEGLRLSGEDGSLVSMEGWKDAGEQGAYFMYNKNVFWGIFNMRTKDWEQRPTASWQATDSAAVSLGFNLSTAQSWTTTVLKRKSIDDNNLLVKACVHEGTDYVNAFWDPDTKELHFGDGDYKTASPLTVLDVVSHEYMHGITQFTSNLVYEYESGALNESYSDITGTVIEFYSQPDGRDAYPHGIDGKSDWLCGEDCWLVDDALRDMRDPKRYGQPSFYLGENWYSGSNDNGGVHANSGVQNFAFYLLSDGGSGINDNHPYAITGIGIEKASAIALYANMYLLTPSSQYRDSRDAWIVAANILGYDTMVVRDVWTAVGLAPLEKHLVVTPDSLDFGATGVGVADTLWVEMSNSGGDTTLVSSVQSDNPCFSFALKLPVTIGPQSVKKAPIIFKPKTIGSLEIGQITFSNDGMENQQIAVKLQGMGTEPAALSYTPHSVAKGMKYGDSTLCTLTVVNTGKAVLKLFGETKENILLNKTPALIPATTRDNNSLALTWAMMYKGSQLDSLQELNPPIQNIGLGLKVLYVTTTLSTPQERDRFCQGILNNPNVAVLDVLIADASTPNSAYLLKYDVVLVSSNKGFADPVALGNTLAEYVDAGGRAILFVASISNISPFCLKGRISTPEYMPIQMAGAGPSSSKPTFADHPITRGLINLECVIPIDARMVQKEGISLGTYSNGIFVGAVHKTKAIVAINVFPMDGAWGGDFIRMIDNTLAWLKSSSWLTLEPERKTIRVKSGDTARFTIGINGKRVYGGFYTGAVDLWHNDPSMKNPCSIPCTLDLDGERLLEVVPASADFGSLWVGRTKKMSFTVSNPGSEATKISSIACDNECFTVSQTAPLTLNPGESKLFTVTFAPQKNVAYTATVTVTSDAEVNPVVTTPLTGSGVNPPIISYSPKSLSVSLPGGTVEKRTVTFSNTGGADYSFNSEVTNYSVNSATRLFGMYGRNILEFNPQNGVLLEQVLLLDSTWIGSETRGFAWDGQYFYCKKYSDTVYVFDMQSATGVRTIALRENGYYPTLGISEKYLIVAGYYPLDSCYILDKQDGTTLYSFQLPENFSGKLTYNGTRNTVYLSTYKNILEYRITDGSVIDSINAYTSYSLAYSMAAKELFVGNYDYIAVYNALTKRYVRNINILTSSCGIACDGSTMPWLTVEPAAALIPAGASLDVTFTFNSTCVLSGLNTASYVMTNSIGGTPGPFTIKCDLEVASQSLLKAVQDSVSFTDTWIKTVDTAVVILKNNGSSPTIIDNIKLKGARFSIGIRLPLTIPAYGQGRFLVFFKPTSCGTFSGKVTVLSDAEDNPKIVIPLQATAVKGPVANPDPAQFSLTVIPGNVHNKTVTLTNTGDVDFPYVIRTRYSMVARNTPAFARAPIEAPFFVMDTREIFRFDLDSKERIGESMMIPDQIDYYEGGLAYDGKVLYAITMNNASDSIKPSMNINTVTVFDPFDATVIRTMTMESLTGTIDGLGVNDRYLFASSQYPPTCYVIDKQSGVVVKSWTIQTPWGSHYGSLTYCSNRNSLFISESDKQSIAEYDPMTGTLLHEFSQPDYGLIGLTYSSEMGALIASRYDGKCFVIDPENGTVMSEFSIPGVTQLCGIAADENGLVPRWLSVNTTAGVVPAAGNTQLKVRFNSLVIPDAGDYFGVIDIVYGGKKKVAPVSIPCTVSVEQARRLVTSPVKVNFGPIDVSTSTTAWIELKNPGNQTTVVTALTSSDPVFRSTMTLPLYIQPQTCVLLGVTFRPSTTGLFKGTLTIESNATESTVPIKLIGRGIESLFRAQ
ncbi:MAG: M4 family metallopeptidase [Chitinivibrionales bacterium]|nr:M4 family metallopeptidase [Chitinivibrionales bacterium]